MKLFFTIHKLFATLLLIMVLVYSGFPAIISDHNCIAEFDSIPDPVLSEVGQTFDIFFAHTSHGSQIITGMVMLRDENPKYLFNYGPETVSIDEYTADLGYLGDTSFVPITRYHLDQPGNTINMVIWAWCAGCSDNTEEGMNRYLDAMNGLENDYPEVTFVYMTGHLDGTGPTGNLYIRNNQIRNYCRNNNKVLYDFADIESYDPDGNYYPMDSDTCYWCIDWCQTHQCPDCSACAHSHCFNCYLKGKAFWWLMASVTGWTNSTPCCVGDHVGNLDGQPGLIDLGDLSQLIDMLFISLTPVNCLQEADLDLSGYPDPKIGDIDLSDLSLMINHLFINLDPLTSCP